MLESFGYESVQELKAKPPKYCDKVWYYLTSILTSDCSDICGHFEISRNNPS